MIRSVPRTLILWSSGLFSLLLFCLIVGATALTVYFDPNQYKSAITDELSLLTGRTVSIAGELSLSLFPEVKVSATDLAISNSQGFDGHFLRIEHVDARIGLTSLLQAKIKLGGLQMRGAHLYLAQNASGANNWADLINSVQTQELPPLTELIASTVSGMSGLAMGGRISDSTLTWDDRKNGRKIVLTGIGIDVEKFRFGQPFAIRTEMDVEVVQPKVRGHLSVSASPIIRMDPRRVELGLVKAHVQNFSGLSPSALSADLSAGVMLNEEQSAIHLQDLLLTGMGSSVRGHVDIEVRKDFSVRGSLLEARCNPRKTAQLLGVKLPLLPDANALQSFEGSGFFTATTQQFSLSKLKIVLDGSKVDGSLNVRNYSRPEIKGTLDIDRLNLDKYVAFKGGPAAQTGVTPGKNPTGPSEFDTVDVEGRLTVDHLTGNGLHGADVRVDGSCRNAVMTIKEAVANLYDGQIRLQGGLDLKTGRTNTEYSMTGVQLGPLLKDLKQQPSISGRADSSGKVTWTGRESAEMLQTLTGALRFLVRDGALHGVDLHQSLRDVTKNLTGNAGVAPGGRTDFQELSGSVALQQGAASTRDLQLRTKFVRVSATGQAHLVRRTVAGQVMLAVNKSAATDEGGLALLAGISIPVKVGGTFEAPEITPDLAALVQQKSKKMVNEVIDSVNPSRWLKFITP